MNDDVYFNLWVRLVRARDAIFAAREKELRKCGVTQREAAILYYIDKIGTAATPAEIARHTFRKPNTISNILDRMAVKGLVKLTKDLDRKNLVRVTHTKKGRESLACSLDRQSFPRIMGVLNAEDREILGGLLEKLFRQAIKEIGGDARLPIS